MLYYESIRKAGHFLTKPFYVFEDTFCFIVVIKQAVQFSLAGAVQWLVNFKKIIKEEWLQILKFVIGYICLIDTWLNLTNDQAENCTVHPEKRRFFSNHPVWLWSLGVYQWLQMGYHEYLYQIKPTYVRIHV